MCKCLILNKKKSVDVLVVERKKTDELNVNIVKYSIFHVKCMNFRKRLKRVYWCVLCIYRT